MNKKGNYIALLDPSLQNNDGKISENLGDLIIKESIVQELSSLFPDKEIISISSHVGIERKNKNLINQASYCFVGGTNLLTSDITGFRLLYIRKNVPWLFPGIKDLILFGAGWGENYGQPISFKTRLFYKTILHYDYVHSTRDQFSSQKLNNAIGLKTADTSCPTMWNLPVFDLNQPSTTRQCLFTLTDYHTNTRMDERLLEIVLDYFDEITFFPQGFSDYSYLQTLPVYQKNKSRIELLPHSYSAFKQYIESNTLTYIGTRLHAGIKCLQHHHKSIIIAIDNRATEIAKDTNLPICLREDYIVLLEWLEGKNVFADQLNIPEKEIDLWKSQFSKYSLS